MSAESGPSNPPLEPAAAAVQLLLTRAETLSLDAHVKPLRYLYQLAVYMTTTMAGPLLKTCPHVIPAAARSPQRSRSGGSSRRSASSSA